jgi:hypothetical protein
MVAADKVTSQVHVSPTNILSAIAQAGGATVAIQILWSAELMSFAANMSVIKESTVFRDELHNKLNTILLIQKMLPTWKVQYKVAVVVIIEDLDIADGIAELSIDTKLAIF